jgi:hypothetical protein
MQDRQLVTTSLAFLGHLTLRLSRSDARGADTEQAPPRDRYGKPTDVITSLNRTRSSFSLGFKIEHQCPRGLDLSLCRSGFIARPAFLYILSGRGRPVARFQREKRTVWLLHARRFFEVRGVKAQADIASAVDAYRGLRGAAGAQLVMVRLQEILADKLEREIANGTTEVKVHCLVGRDLLRMESADVAVILVEEYLSGQVHHGLHDELMFG